MGDRHPVETPENLRDLSSAGEIRTPVQRCCSSLGPAQPAAWPHPCGTAAEHLPRKTPHVRALNPKLKLETHNWGTQGPGPGRQPLGGHPMAQQHGPRREPHQRARCEHQGPGRPLHPQRQPVHLQVERVYQLPMCRLCHRLFHRLGRWIRHCCEFATPVRPPGRPLGAHRQPVQYRG